jgi:hypothetical protein
MGRLFFRAAGIFISLFLLFYLLSFLFPIQKAKAATVCGYFGSYFECVPSSSLCTGSSPGSCYTGSGGACNSAQCGGSCGCVSTTNDQSWARYDPICGNTNPGSYEWGWIYSSRSCSSADKCMSSSSSGDGYGGSPTETGLRAGTCNCGYGGEYKACCSGNTPHLCSFYYGSSRDATAPPEGTCPAGTTTVRCSGSACATACGTPSTPTPPPSSCTTAPFCSDPHSHCGSCTSDSQCGGSWCSSNTTTTLETETCVGGCCAITSAQANSPSCTPPPPPPPPACDVQDCSGCPACSNTTVTQSCQYDRYSGGGSCTSSTAPPATCNIPECGYSAGGKVYVDLDKSGDMNGSDYPYPGGTVTICQGDQPSGCPSAYQTLTTGSDGTYTNTGLLPSGTYTALLSIPLGFEAFSPKPPVIVFTVGGSCAPAAKCSSGNISGLDFSITNSVPWMQSVGGDIYARGFNNPIPSSATTAVPYGGGGAYASVFGLSNTPGIIYSGDLNPSFGLGGGSASSNPPFGWTSGSSQYPNVFSSLGAPFSTSFSFMDGMIDKFGVRGDVKALSTVCPVVSDCSLSGAASGIYYSYSDVTLKASTIQNGTNIILLVGKRSVVDVTQPTTPTTVITPMNLNITGKVLVAVGSTLFVTVSGDINVDKTVGEALGTTYCTAPQGANALSMGCDLEGYFSTDNNFNLKGNPVGSCPAADLRFNLGGAVVVGALGTGGTFSYATRDMCADGATNPVFSITDRADFVLNSPDIFKIQRRIWQEVAP